MPIESLLSPYDACVYRRSVRKFLKDLPVEKEKIEDLKNLVATINSKPGHIWKTALRFDLFTSTIDVGSWWPHGGGTDVWLGGVCKKKAEGDSPFTAVPAGALLERWMLGGIPTDARPLIDFGYAMENLIIRAAQHGLGTCWLGGTLNRTWYLWVYFMETKQQVDYRSKGNRRRVCIVCYAYWLSYPCIFWLVFKNRS